MNKILSHITSFLLALLIGLFAAPSVEAAPPQNFQLETLVTSGLNGPSGFEIAPDGRIFVLERTGKIKIVKNGVVLPTPFADLPSIASGDRGLIGIAFDPAFGVDNHYVYFYYTGLDKLNRLVRFDASTDIGQEGPYLLYQTNSPSEELHVGGSIQFGPDGRLYFAVGDNGYPPNAQNLSNPHGKILRINKDGSIPMDNPFVGQTGALPEIWAYGLRNPWRFQFDSATGELYGGDVGDFTWEEVNHLRAGQNYGWPTNEGLCQFLCNNSVSPIYAYNHDNQSAAVTGGPVYRGTNFPAEYNGSLFFGDYAKGFIRRIQLDANGNNAGVFDFDNNAGSVVDMKIAPDGSMYYITYFPGRLYRVSYNTGNQAPVANATANVTKGVEPLTVNFSSAGSSDPDGAPITYLWRFGDGTTSTEANPAKTYTVKGTYTVELAVSDGTNTSNAVPVIIQVGIPPTINIGQPTDGSNYRAGDSIHWTISALDGVGFDIDDNDISMEVFLHHDTHFHPMIGPIVGRQGDFVIPDHGEASPNTWYEFKATAVDENGLSTSKSVFIYPIKSTITVNTVPAGMQIMLDGVPRQTPLTFEAVEKFRRELSAPTTQTVNGVTYQFESWSSNQPQRHFITIPTDDASYTANYRVAPSFTGEYFNGVELQGAPVLTRQDAAINFDWGDGSPDPVVPNNNFSVRWTKNQYFAAGKYRFSAATDDGLRLYIDDQLLIDRWLGGVVADSAVVTLPAGEHTIRMEYREDGGGAYARLDWDLTPDQPEISSDFQAEYFNNITLSGTPVLTRAEPAIDHVWDNGSPAPTVNADGFSARWTKTETLAAGSYRFTTSSDDGVRLYVDGELLIDQWIDQGTTTYTADKTLAAGEHTIRVEYYENGGGAVMQMSFAPITTPTPPTPGTGFNGEYFANKTLTGTPTFLRNDTTINFDWAGGSPDPTIPNDNFSARWTKTETLAAGNYEFSVTGDDGVRLYVDGELLINQWVDQAPSTYRATKALTAGNHTIVMEYYENGGGAVARLNYALTQTPPPPPTTAFRGEYFNNTDLSAPITMTRNDAAINFDWAGGSPDPLINANNFSVRWTKDETFEAGTYQFNITGDDGVRIFVDGQLLINGWFDQASTTYTAQQVMTAGVHTVVVEYYERGGGAAVQANYAKVADPVTPPPANGNYQARFWNLPAPVTAPAIPAEAPTVTREDTAINFAWDGASPAVGINPDGFIAQWIKTQTFTAGTYRFTTTSDDGIRVYVDDQIVIDQWNDHGSTTHNADRTVSAGDHVIRVEYYENSGGAVAQFSFAPVTTTPPATGDQFTAEFFNNMTLTGAPVLTRQDNGIQYIMNDLAPIPQVNPDGFSIRWIKQRTFAAGTYSFRLQSDDGVRFYIDDQLIVNDWTDHAMMTYEPTVTLTEGVHTLRIEYYENTGGAVMIFQEL